VNRNHYKPLHYVLIILLMFAPIRSATAVQQAHCDMDEMNMDEMSMPMSMQDHDMHAMHDMSPADNAIDLTIDERDVSNTQCCCCDNDCVSNCDIGVSVSLVMQVSVYSPVFVNTSNTDSYISDLLLRTLTPPSRPPAIIS
jgi:hypothetical protein